MTPTLLTLLGCEPARLELIDAALALADKPGDAFPVRDEELAACGTSEAASSVASGCAAEENDDAGDCTAVELCVQRPLPPPPAPAPARVPEPWLDRLRAECGDGSTRRTELSPAATLRNLLRRCDPCGVALGVAGVASAAGGADKPGVRAPGGPLNADASVPSVHCSIDLRLALAAACFGSCALVGRVGLQGAGAGAAAADCDALGLLPLSVEFHASVVAARGSSDNDCALVGRARGEVEPTPLPAAPPLVPSVLAPLPRVVARAAACLGTCASLGVVELRRFRPGEAVGESAARVAPLPLMTAC